MSAHQQAHYVVALGLSFALVVAGGYSAFYVAPRFQQMPISALVSLLSVLVILLGVFVMVRFFRKLEAISKSTSELHIAGMDIDVGQTKKPH
jgi:hypothetical protein